MRLGIIGCGAVTQRYHLPTVRDGGEFAVSALVDTDEPRARSLSGEDRGVRVASDFREILDAVDAVLIATPHSSHAEIATECLRQGKHVLCEKPLATTAAECRALGQVAKDTRATLAVALMRRCIPANRWVRSLVERRWLGEVTGFRLEEGMRYDWPTASGFFWQRETAGGGVLVDTGAHALDLLMWWLGDWDSVEYRDDNLGNMEANCTLTLRMRSGVEGVVELSRTHELRNTARLDCSAGWIEIALGPPWTVVLHDSEAGVGVHATTDADTALVPSSPPPESTNDDAFVRLWQQFGAAIRGEAHALATAEAAERSAQLMEACYAGRRPLPQPWVEESCPGKGEERTMDWQQARIALTGATGFIGGRLAEHLALQRRAHVRCLVRDFAGCAPLSRFPVELVRCGLADTDAHKAALAGCTHVVHCAHDWNGTLAQSRDTNVAGTESLFQASQQAGCRFVHLSTDAVHAFPSEPEIDEGHPLSKYRHTYVQTKVEIEGVLGQGTSGALRPVILRPGIVFGPGFGAWTSDVVSRLRERTLPLVDGGKGLCCTAYVDNLVHAVCLACESPDAPGQTFFVNDGSPLTWREYLTPFAEAVGVDLDALPQLASEDVRSVRPRIGKTLGEALAIVEVREALWQVEWLRRLWLLARPAVRGRPAEVPEPGQEPAPALQQPAPGRWGTPDEVFQLRIFANQTRYSIRRVREVLGYVPPVPWEEAAARTLAWLRYARLVPTR